MDRDTMEPFVAEYIDWLEPHNKQLFHRLMEYSSTLNHKLKISFLFNAYQPRCNRLYKIKKEFLKPPENPFFLKLYEKIKSYEIERKETDNLLAIALTDCYLPLMAIGESFPHVLSIAFPQVTVDVLKLRYPNWHQTLMQLNRGKIIDLGVSSYHHSFAPLLDERLLYQEYSTALDVYLKSYKNNANDVKDAKSDPIDVSVHIPECAVSPTLLDVFARLQENYSVKLITVLDSEYHNEGGAYDIGKVNEIHYFSKGNKSTLNVLFSNNHFSRKLFSFPPESDPKTVGFWYFTRMFESIAKPQPYPYWEKLKNGDEIHFVIHTDAETIGFYCQERVYSLYLMLHLMKCFDIDAITLTDAAHINIVQMNSTRPLLYKTWDMGTSGGMSRWIKNEYDSSTQFFFITKEIYPYLLEELVKRENEMTPIERKILWVARMRYANALTSCPHWWSEPDSVAGKQFAQDILETGKQIRKLEKYITPDKKEVLKATERFESHPFVKRSLKCQT